MLDAEKDREIDKKIAEEWLAAKMHREAFDAVIRRDEGHQRREGDILQCSCRKTQIPALEI